jgi:dynein heavy chain
MASKEYSLEKALDRMEAEWQPVNLELKAYKTTGTHILSGAAADAVQALLDDHVVKATTMAASRYAKALAGRIKAWVECLTEIQAVLDVWLKVQSTWLYLEPIFGSEDIMQQMPVEGRRFRTVDETWRALVRGAVAVPKALLALRQPGQLAALTNANDLLDAIQKGLNAYLESKRLIFPRFFFLTNDELLEILAETKDPTRVQPHLKKVRGAPARARGAGPRRRPGCTRRRRCCTGRAGRCW